MNAPAHFSPLFGQVSRGDAGFDPDTTEFYRDAIPIGSLVNAQMRSLRKLRRQMPDRSASHISN